MSIRMEFLLVNQAPGKERCEQISIKDALLLRKIAQNKGTVASFLCPVCKQRATPHGGKVPLHGEHFRGDPKCSPSNIICPDS